MAPEFFRREYGGCCGGEERHAHRGGGENHRIDRVARGAAHTVDLSVYVCMYGCKYVCTYVCM